VRQLRGPATRLRVYVSEGDRFRGRPLAHEIVLEARSAGLAGATVLRGSEGFGASTWATRAGVLDLPPEAPVVIEIVDEDERVRDFLPRLLELVGGGLVTREPVQVVRYAHEERVQPV
jgi:PII-like signaling protein